MVKMSAGEFKAKCLKLMEHVKNSHEEILITKHGKPVAKLIPVETKGAVPLFGFLKGSVRVHADITKPNEENWNVLEG